MSFLCYFFLLLFLENFGMHFSIIYLNSKNIDPKFESSFANKLSLQSRFWACNARFLAREAKALKVLFFLPTSSQILPIFSIFLFSTILNYFQWFFSIFSKFASLIDCLKGLSARKAKAQSKCTFFFFFQPLLKFLLIFSIFFFTNFKLFSVIF